MIWHYYHCYADGAWETPVREHFVGMQFQSGLDFDGTIIGLVGSRENRQRFHEATGFYTDPECDTGWEQETLRRLQRDVQGMNDGDLVFYAHSKGAANPSEFNDSWRRTMTHFTVHHWRELSGRIPQYDIAGIWWISRTYHEHPHFQGNFWWARAGYLKTLPPIDTGSRWEAELWLEKGNPRVFDAYPGSAGGSPHYGSEDFRCPLCGNPS